MKMPENFAAWRWLPRQ